MKTYYNLGQCVGDRMVYLRSTDVEQQNYERLLWSIPDEWFYWMAIGEPIEVIDKSSNAGKIGRIFIPVLVDVLNYIYFGTGPQNKWLKAHFDIAIGTLKSHKLLETRYLFWKGKIAKVDIVGKTIHVDKEPNLLAGMTPDKVALSPDVVRRLREDNSWTVSASDLLWQEALGKVDGNVEPFKYEAKLGPDGWVILRKIEDDSHDET